MYVLEEINRRAANDPAQFLAQCRREYEAEVEQAVKDVIANVENSVLVLISGPSGAAKTTTAAALKRGLEAAGHKAYVLSMDEYFLDVTPWDTPILKNGQYDFESPLCLDIDLLRQHFAILSLYREVVIPHFDFNTRRRTVDTGFTIKPSKGDFVIFEGIHALNEQVTGGPSDAAKFYVSADPDVTLNGKTVISGGDLRFIRRAVRDIQFRGTSLVETLERRPTVQRGETLYIQPNKHTADRVLQTFQPCELGLYRDRFLELARREGILDRCGALAEALEAACPIDEALLEKTSVIREFLGGAETE